MFKNMFDTNFFSNQQQHQTRNQQQRPYNAESGGSLFSSLNPFATSRVSAPTAATITASQSPASTNAQQQAKQRSQSITRKNSSRLSDAERLKVANAAWTPPNDRELMIRAKLKTGWSSRSANHSCPPSQHNSTRHLYQPPASSPYGSHQQQQQHQLAHSGLISDNEYLEIEMVMQRAIKIDEKEQNRIGKLMQRFDGIKPLGNGETTCLICNANFGLLGATPRICNDCLKNCCATCCFDTLTSNKQSTIWLCKICSEYRDFWKKSGAWFSQRLPPAVEQMRSPSSHSFQRQQQQKQGSAGTGLSPSPSSTSSQQLSNSASTDKISINSYKSNELPAPPVTTTATPPKRHHHHRHHRHHRQHLSRFDEHDDADHSSSFDDADEENDEDEEEEEEEEDEADVEEELDVGDDDEDGSRRHLDVLKMKRDLKKTASQATADTSSRKSSLTPAPRTSRISSLFKRQQSPQPLHNNETTSITSSNTLAPSSALTRSHSKNESINSLINSLGGGGGTSSQTPSASRENSGSRPNSRTNSINSTGSYSLAASQLNEFNEIEQAKHQQQRKSSAASIFAPPSPKAARSSPSTPVSASEVARRASLTVTQQASQPPPPPVIQYLSADEEETEESQQQEHAHHHQQQLSSTNPFLQDVKRSSSGGIKKQQSSGSARSSSKSNKSNKSLGKEALANLAMANAAAAAAAAAAEASRRSDSISSTGSSILQQMELKTKQQQKPKEYLGSLHFALEYIASLSQLKINIISASNLPARDSNGLSDPYVKMHLLPGLAKATKLRTKTVYKNLNPQFNETLHYDGISLQDLDTKTLRLTVLDEDKFGFDFIGEYRLPLKTLQRNEINYFNVTLEDKNEIGDETDTSFKGKINFALKYCKTTKCLYVKINRCVQLLPMDSGVSSDPFVEITLQPYDKESKHKARTTVKWKTLDPEYFEEFKFPNIDLKTLLTKTIEIAVWDKDFGSNDFIGVVELGQKRDGDELKHFYTMVKNTELYHEQWHTLHDRTTTLSADESCDSKSNKST